MASLRSRAGLRDDQKSSQAEMQRKENDEGKTQGRRSRNSETAPEGAMWVTDMLGELERGGTSETFGGNGELFDNRNGRCRRRDVRDD